MDRPHRTNGGHTPYETDRFRMVPKQEKQRRHLQILEPPSNRTDHGPTNVSITRRQGNNERGGCTVHAHSMQHLRTTRQQRQATTHEHILLPERTLHVMRRQQTPLHAVASRKEGEIPIVEILRARREDTVAPEPTLDITRGRQNPLEIRCQQLHQQQTIPGITQNPIVFNYYIIITHATPCLYAHTQVVTALHSDSNSKSSRTKT